jgi:MFS family permease
VEAGSEQLEQHERTHRGWLTRGVLGVGLASFFSDAGHEITTAVLPSFVTSTLRASAGALGVIEGISDALTGVSKLVGGSLANDETYRLRLARGGYLFTAAATGAIGLTAAVWQAGILRGLAWVARGLRSPARDSVLASIAPREAYGRAFGLERAGDNLGAVVGPLLAAGLIGWIGIRHTMYVAAIPGLFSALAISVAAAEARRLHVPVRRRVRLELRALRAAGLARPLLPVAFFELANCATTLLILRATHMLEPGRSASSAAEVAILLYAGHNAFATLFAYGGGHWIDRVGPGKAFATGAGLFVAAYSVFALPVHGLVAPLLGFALAGSGIGIAETAESTLVAHRLPDELRSSGFGLLGGIQSAGDLASSAIVGILWTAFSPTVAFTYAAALMVVSLLATARAA